MKKVNYDQIVNAVEQLCIRCACDLPDDVLQAIKAAKETETKAGAIDILNKLIENAKLAAEKNIPICQDTGLAVVFIEQGSNVLITPPLQKPDATIIDAVNQGVEQGYEKGLLRKSIVAEPLAKRENTQSNTPAVIHYTIADGDRLKISLMQKGGGCENKSQFKMFNPTDTKEAVSEWITQVVKNAGANACPPFVLGIGIGGSFEQCCLLSKKALLRKLTDHNKDEFYAEMESELLTKINSLNIGPQGLGGNTTALAVKIETAPCHIASLPVAVNIECHAHRHETTTL